MLHYKPKDGWVGDVIPFYWKGTYHVFYLKAPPEPKRHGADFTPYAHISTTDFLTWREHPTVIEPATDPAAPDAISCWTGSVIERNGVFHLFYTGHNLPNPDCPQSICVARSRDLDHWEKDPANPILLPDPARFRKSDWRDPFVFWSEREGCYLMTITAMRVEDSFWKGGSLVVARSPDLAQWTVGEVFYNPGNHGYPECSDLFEMGGRHYVVASIHHKTCYRTGKTELGPWSAARTECFDGVLNYAAKTIAGPDGRFVLGWVRTLHGARDNGHWEWAGHLAFPREIVQDADGTLFVKLPARFAAIRGGQVADLAGSGALVQSAGDGSGTELDGTALYADGFTKEPVPADFDAEFEFTVADQGGIAGVVFRADGQTHPGYEVAVDLDRQEMTLRMHTDRYHRIAVVPVEAHAGRTMHMRVIVEDSVVEAFLNDRFALAGRCYAQPAAGRIGMYAERCRVVIASGGVYRLNDSPEAATENHEEMSRASIAK